MVQLFTFRVTQRNWSWHPLGFDSLVAALFTSWVYGLEQLFGGARKVWAVFLAHPLMGFRSVKAFSLRTTRPSSAGLKARSPAREGTRGNPSVSTRFVRWCAPQVKGRPCDTVLQRSLCFPQLS